MKPLETIIARLKSDPLFAIRVSNAETIKTICANVTAIQMIDKYGGVEQFFNEIVATQGNMSIVIQPRKKNGSSWKDAGAPEAFNFRAKTEPQVHQAIPMQSPTLPQPATDIFGLMGGMQGEMIHRHFDHPRLVALADKLTMENERLKDQVTELKEAALENKFADSKAAGNKEMLLGIGQLLTPFLGMVIKPGGGIPDQGLGAVDPTQHLSDVKRELIQAVTNTQDNLNSYLTVILQGMTANTAFGTELLTLLQTHKLI